MLAVAATPFSKFPSVGPPDPHFASWGSTTASCHDENNHVVDGGALQCTAIVRLIETVGLSSERWSSPLQESGGIVSFDWMPHADLAVFHHGCVYCAGT